MVVCLLPRRYFIFPFISPDNAAFKLVHKYANSVPVHFPTITYALSSALLFPYLTFLLLRIGFPMVWELVSCIVLSVNDVACRILDRRPAFHTHESLTTWESQSLPAKHGLIHRQPVSSHTAVILDTLLHMTISQSLHHVPPVLNFFLWKAFLSPNLTRHSTTIWALSHFPCFSFICVRL